MSTKKSTKKNEAATNEAQTAPVKKSTKKSTKKKATTTAPVVKAHANGAHFSQSRPGVLGCMLDVLLASGEKGASKADIMAELQARFADRDVAQMTRTLNMQVPAGFFIEKGIVIESTRDTSGITRYTINKEASEAYVGASRKCSAEIAAILAQRNHNGAPARAGDGHEKHGRRALPWQGASE